MNKGTTTIQPRHPAKSHDAPADRGHNLRVADLPATRHDAPRSSRHELSAAFTSSISAPGTGGGTAFTFQDVAVAASAATRGGSPATFRNPALAVGSIPRSAASASTGASSYDGGGYSGSGFDGGGYSGSGYDGGGYSGSASDDAGPSSTVGAGPARPSSGGGNDLGALIPLLLLLVG